MGKEQQSPRLRAASTEGHSGPGLNWAARVLSWHLKGTLERYLEGYLDGYVDGNYRIPGGIRGRSLKAYLERAGWLWTWPGRAWPSPLWV